MAELFGKSYQEVGKSTSPLLLRSNGDIKLQWGGKFIDLLKNGKINSQSKEVLKQIEDSDSIKDNGIYLVTKDNSIWICIDGTKLLLSDTGNTYVSFMSEQTTTGDQKHQALTNAGFYYKSIEDASNAGLSAGIIYNEADNKLYVVKDGVLQEYNILTNPSTSNSNSSSNQFKEIFISDMHIYKDGTMRIDSSQLTFYIDEVQAITMSRDKFQIGVNSIFNKDLFSINYKSDQYGWSLFHNQKGKTTLEVDSIKWRNIEKELPVIRSILDKSTIYSNNNIILYCEQGNDNKVIAYIKYNIEFKVGDYVFIYVSLPHFNYLVTSTNGTITINQTVPDGYTLQVTTTTNTYLFSGEVVKIDGTGDLVSAIMLVNGKEDSQYNISLGKTRQFKRTPYEVLITDIDSHSNTLSFIIDNDAIRKDFENECYNTKICASRVPLVYQTQDYYSLKDLTKDKINPDTGNVLLDDNGQPIPDDQNHTKIGTISTEEFKNILQAEWQEDSDDKPNVEYSKVGIYSDNFIGINSQLYNAVFKKGQLYPRYEKDLTIPEGTERDYKLNKKFDTVIPNLKWIKQLIDIATPIGTIVAWHGDSIPKGWSICDGSNGTPNLIGKFIKADTSEKYDNETDLDDDNKLLLTKEHLPEHHHPHKPHNHILSGSPTYTDTVYHNTYTGSYTTVGSASEDNSTSAIGSISYGGSDSDIVGITVNGSDFEVSKETSEEQSVNWENRKIKIEPHAYSLVFIMKYQNLYDMYNI